MTGKSVGREALNPVERRQQSELENLTEIQTGSLMITLESFLYLTICRLTALLMRVRGRR